MSGRIIMEYRDGTGVTRVERNVSLVNNWRDPTNEQIKLAMDRTVERLYAGVTGPAEETEIS